MTKEVRNLKSETVLDCSCFAVRISFVIPTSTFEFTLHSSLSLPIQLYWMTALSIGRFSRKRRVGSSTDGIPNRKHRENHGYATLIRRWSEGRTLGRLPRRFLRTGSLYLADRRTVSVRGRHDRHWSPDLRWTGICSQRRVPGMDEGALVVVLLMQSRMSNSKSE